MATPRLAPGEHRDPVATTETHPRPSKRGRREGAPTKYRPQFCAKLLQAARDGLSLSAFAGELETTGEVLWDWQRRFPAFATACQQAKLIRLATWERIAIGIARGELPYAGTAMTIFALKNCAPDEWREKTVVEHDISDRVADRLEAARQRTLGELKVIDAAVEYGSEHGPTGELDAKVIE